MSLLRYVILLKTGYPTLDRCQYCCGFWPTVLTVVPQKIQNMYFLWLCLW